MIEKTPLLDFIHVFLSICPPSTRFFFAFFLLISLLSSRLFSLLSLSHALLVSLLSHFFIHFSSPHSSCSLLSLLSSFLSFLSILLLTPPRHCHHTRSNSLTCHQADRNSPAFTWDCIHADINSVSKRLEAIHRGLSKRGLNVDLRGVILHTASGVTSRRRLRRQRGDLL